MNTQNGVFDVAEAKRRARAELEAYRARKRSDAEARAKAEQTAEEEIALTIQARRDAEAKRAELAAGRQRLYAEREAQIEARRQAEREQRLEADPRLRIAETPARRAAKVLRQRLGGDFDAFVSDLKLINFKLFTIELERIPADERAEAIHRQREELAARLAAEAATLPAPESEEEAAILRSHGFVVPVSVAARRAELDAGAL